MIDKLGYALCLTLVTLTPLAADPFRHSSGELREYHRDWLAACPDVIDESANDYYGFSCFASTGSQQLNSAGLPAYKLTLMRNRLTGEIDIAFTVALDDAEVDTSGALMVEFGGERAMRFAFPQDLETRYNTINQFYVSDPERKAALLEQMQQRNALTLTVPLRGGAKDSQSVWLSMRGVLASLDFMAAHARKVAQY